MFSKDIFKSDFSSNWKLIRNENLNIRIAENEKSQTCCLKLYSDETEMQGKLEVFKVVNEKEQRWPLRTICSKNIVQIKEWNDSAHSIWIESKGFSFTILDINIATQTQWLKDLLAYLYPKTSGKQNKRRAPVPLIEQPALTPTNNIFNVEILNPSMINSTEKKFTFEIIMNKTILLKSKKRGLIIESWEINEVKGFKFYEDKFIMLAGRRLNDVQPVKKTFEFFIEVAEIKNLRKLLSGITKPNSNSNTSNLTYVTSQRDASRYIHINSDVYPSGVPTPPPPISSPPRLTDQQIMNSKQKIIPSSDDYEEPYEEFEEYVPAARISNSSKIIPSGEEYEEPGLYEEFQDTSKNMQTAARISNSSKINPSGEEYEELGLYEEFQDNSKNMQTAGKPVTFQKIIPSSEEYEEPYEDHSSNQSIPPPIIPKSEKSSNKKFFELKKKVCQKFTKPLDRYSGPVNEDLYTCIETSSQELPKSQR